MQMSPRKVNYLLTVNCNRKLISDWKWKSGLSQFEVSGTNPQQTSLVQAPLQEEELVVITMCYYGAHVSGIFKGVLMVSEIPNSFIINIPLKWEKCYQFTVCQPSGIIIMTAPPAASCECHRL